MTNDSPAVAAGWDCHVHVFDGRPATAASHYQPPVRAIEALQDEGRALGVGHAVLVQPSVYGTDNGLLLATLRAGAGRHRGVVVVDERVAEADLDAMHAAGVRGVRFNLVSPVGQDDTAIGALVPRAAARGWHVQWYVAPTRLATLAELQRRYRATFVLDHLAGLTPALGAEAGFWSDLERLAGGGAWIKLSGWYRLAAAAPYTTLDPVIARVARLFGPRCVWGSDWPHTRFLEHGCRDAPPPYAATWTPVVRALGAATARAIRERNPLPLYR